MSQKKDTQKKDTQRYIDALVNLHTERTNLKRDLEVTGIVQSLLLPKKDLETTPHYKIASFYQTAGESGGDWWWYDIHSDGGLSLILADITGHGAGSAMVTAMVASSYHSLNSVRNDNGKPDFSWLIQNINQNLFRICSGKYEMALTGIQLLADGKMNCWCGGAPPIMIMSIQGEIQTIYMRSTFLGSERSIISTDERKLEKGSRILAFTDGAYEFQTADRPRFGLKNLRRLLLSTRGLSIEEARNSITSQMEAFRMSVSLSDDLTFIIIDYE